jgi:hypothetical protein
LENFKKDLNNLEKYSKKEISILQKKLELITKEYRQIKQNFNVQNKTCAKYKLKIEELVESKAAYENVKEILLKEVELMTYFKPNGNGTDHNNGKNNKSNNQTKSNLYI